jgi:hypothetical protein
MKPAIWIPSCLCLLLTICNATSSPCYSSTTSNRRRDTINKQGHRHGFAAIQAGQSDRVNNQHTALSSHDNKVLASLLASIQGPLQRPVLTCIKRAQPTHLKCLLLHALRGGSLSSEDVAMTSVDYSTATGFQQQRQTESITPQQQTVDNEAQQDTNIKAWIQWLDDLFQSLEDANLDSSDVDVAIEFDNLQARATSIIHRMDVLQHQTKWWKFVWQALDNETLVRTINTSTHQAVNERLERLVAAYRDYLEDLREVCGNWYYHIVLRGPLQGKLSDTKAIPSLVAARLFQETAACPPLSIIQSLPMGQSLLQVYADSLEGFLSDLQTMTEDYDLQREQEEMTRSMLRPDNHDESSVHRLFDRITVPPWMIRLAPRILVLGVNYLQGWWAWQSVQRAALEREDAMPKFPIL